MHDREPSNSMSVGVGRHRPNPARVDRELRRDALTREQSRLLFEHDVSQSELARMWGTRPQIIQRQCDREQRETPALADVPGAPLRLALGFLQWAASRLERPYRLVPECGDEHGEDHLRRLAEVGRQSDEARQAYLTAIADGHMSDDELRGVAREYREAADASARVAHEAEQRLRDRQMKRQAQRVQTVGRGGW